MLNAINPSNGELLKRYAVLSRPDIDTHIERAQKAFLAWRGTPLRERAVVLNRVAEQLRAQKAELGKLMTDEMGKPVKEAGPEVEKSAWCAEHYASHAEGYLADQVLASDASRSYVRHQPLGVLLGVLPWNAPLWIAFRYLAPALMAGNTCVMKHDPHVPGCAEAIANLFRKAGAPDDIVVNLPVVTQDVEHAIRHPAIQAVSFTGSAKAGGIVAAVAASEIKHSVLELGGSDPFVVLQDADLDTAADVATLSRTINAGQSCIAAKRIIVEAPVYDAFVEKLGQRLAKLKVGDPNNPDTDIGPIARADLRDNLHRQVTETREQGARCLLGGEPVPGPGFYYPVTLLADVQPGMCAFAEEVFGPVMVVIKAEDSAHAITLANDSDYGLGAAIWSADVDRAEQLAWRIDAGQVSVNGIVKTDPRLPSGGIKRSGFGRELGPHGILEFVNAKQIWLK
ncbi:NAD-dependent succinate-semialdehyde dehydrogenase [Reinekea sp. G2M2-21]|uniref:NAD-dependent succinate-semialdehyde dehydrogenase n=1 Tax=Reinekea sp. G2M2-21 TaxID=2788942 RepID=UPI0018AB7274|nr:NAD-dependent succinate-semialdehyde dehydrogenase [Reinekea sp. G2M2-21]